MKNLRKIAFAIVVLFAFNKNTNAQYCWNTINTATTDWRISGSPNTWNWTQQGVTHPVYLSHNMSTPSFLIELPYFCGGGIGSGGCGNLNTGQYYYISAANQDIKPEDGWELIVKNFGTPNPPSTSIGGRGVDNPFFVLYNKHTGKMKIYYAITGVVSANSSYLSIHFSDTKLKRALFAHALPVANTLLNFNPKLDFNTFNQYENSRDYYWMVAEIQTTYDPCTCSLNGLPSENSTIEILPFTTTTTTIDATIEGTATQQIANNGQMLATTDGKTAATSNGGDFEKIIAAGQAGLKGYTEWDGYKDQYDGMVDKWNDEYKNKLVKDWFDEYVKKHKQYQGITGLNDKLTLWNNLGKTDDEFKKSIGIKNLNDYEQNNDWYALKSIAGYLPYVGTAIGIIDFFVNGGSQAEPAKPSPPMVFNVSLQLKGTIATPYPQAHVAFLNPGSPTLTAIPALQPYYNNILGVFNILKPPALKFGGINYTIPEGNFHFIDYSINQDLGAVNVKLTNQIDAQTESDIWKNKPIFKQFKLTEDVKYIVNPAAKVEVEMIDACFVLEYDNTPNLSISNHDFINIQNYPSYPFYNGLFNGSMSLSDRITNIQQTGLDLEYISADKSVVRFRTKYVPLTCLKNETFTLFNGASQPKVYIKMLIKMKRTDIMNAEEITEIVSYDINSSYINASSEATTCKAKFKVLQNLNGVQHNDPIVIAHHLNFVFDQFLGFTCLPYPNIQEYQYITYASNMNQSNLYGTITFPDNAIISDNTFIKAAKIILGKHLSFGTNVHLISAEQMEVNPENTISPEVILEIQPLTNLDLWQCPTNIDIATLKATDEEILAVCNSSNYVNSATFNKKGDENTNDNSKTESQNGKILSISPNPTNGIASIQFSSLDKSMVTIEIYNLTGKLLSTPVKELDIKEGIYNWNIDLGNFENGIYIFRLSGTDGYTECKKVVLIK